MVAPSNATTLLTPANDGGMLGTNVPRSTAPAFACEKNAVTTYARKAMLNTMNTFLKVSKF